MGTTTVRKRKQLKQRSRTRPRVRLLEDEFPLILSSVLTVKVVKAFAKHIRRGIPPNVVCDYLGVSPSTFWGWLDRGRSYLSHCAEGEAVPNPGTESPEQSMDRAAAIFVREYQKARAKYIMRQSGRMHDEGNSDWYRHMAILERRDRATWGRNLTQGSGDAEEYDPDDKFL